jgi:hypothetical protein
MCVPVCIQGNQWTMDPAMYLQGPRESVSLPYTPLSSQLQPSDQAESEGYPMMGGTGKAGEPLCSVLWNFLSGAQAQPQPLLIPLTPSLQILAFHIHGEMLLPDCLHLWKGGHRAQAPGKARPLG